MSVQLIEDVRQNCTSRKGNNIRTFFSLYHAFFAASKTLPGEGKKKLPPLFFTSLPLKSSKCSLEQRIKLLRSLVFPAIYAKQCPVLFQKEPRLVSLEDLKGHGTECLASWMARPHSQRAPEKFSNAAVDELPRERDIVSFLLTLMICKDSPTFGE